MTPRKKLPFKLEAARLEIAGQVIEDLVVEGLIMCGTRTAPIAAEGRVDDEPNSSGRPSFSTIIDVAVAALGPKLRSCSTIAERSRRVLKHLAQIDATSIPARRTVDAYFAGRRKVCKNPGRKNSRRI